MTSTLRAEGHLSPVLFRHTPAPPPLPVALALHITTVPETRICLMLKDKKLMKMRIYLLPKDLKSPPLLHQTTLSTCSPLGILPLPTTLPPPQTCCP